MTMLARFDASKTFFTSDLHLGDEWTAKMRGLKGDTVLQDKIAADRWDAAVPPDATVVIVGDVFRGIDRSTAWKWLRLRPGKKVLIRGNWDTDLGMITPFEWVADNATLILDERIFKVNHTPYGAKDSMPDVGLPLLHGHTHKHSTFSRSDKETLQIHVGWDAWWKPISGLAILALYQELMEAG